MIVGNPKLTIKINKLSQPKTIENGWQQFDLDCDGRIITITVKPKIYNKLIDDTSNYPLWVTAMSNDKPRSIYAGKLGQSTEYGFVLEEPSIQVFERKPKAETTFAVGAAS
ncbi:MAG: fertility inhibition FinO-like protein [Nostoc sp. DedQUE08]|uniref:fertility inhibition FinO-like protein n=1 Tax=Nostoc sp. DedQUE08 TaxID=3075393 RepID=UPI002AD25A7D|nr:fertility inhibition FinO-like protein [Nostoc sp. DedQUE08]MDZ8066234.1 fertility inhibition FinO-like protein [Nostoc sp. DedQUE08]